MKNYKTITITKNTGRTEGVSAFIYEYKWNTISDIINIIKENIWLHGTQNLAL